ncbi:MAG TPA: universal stress protein, partial [Actinotalea sp.]|nr:universal stress protein [Actinotalea sp.]
VVLTAAAWAAAAGVSLCCAFVDPGRYVVAELADGSVVHRPVDPDGPDDRWLATRDLIAEHLSRVLDPLAVPRTGR